MSVIAIILWLLGQGFVVEQITQFLKALPFVKANPKLTAAVLNVLAVFALQYFNVGGVGQAVSTFLLAVAAALIATFGTVGTYEVLKSVKGLVGTGAKGGTPNA